MTNTPAVIAAAVVPLSGFAGLKTGAFLASAMPHDSGTFEAVLAQLLGPFGFLVGTLIAIRWLVKQLEESRKETTDNIRTLAEISTACKSCIEQNTEALESMKEVIGKCKGGSK